MCLALSYAAPGATGVTLEKEKSLILHHLGVWSVAYRTDNILFGVYLNEISYGIIVESTLE